MKNNLISSSIYILRLCRKLEKTHLSSYGCSLDAFEKSITERCIYADSPPLQTLTHTAVTHFIIKILDEVQIVLKVALETNSLKLLNSCHNLGFVFRVFANIS